MGGRKFQDRAIAQSALVSASVGGGSGLFVSSSSADFGSGWGAVSGPAGAEERLVPGWLPASAAGAGEVEFMVM